MQQILEVKSNFLAGGVNSPIPCPKYYPTDIVRGEGAIVENAQGNQYIDLWMGYGALLRGHADPLIQQTILTTIKDGWFFSVPRKEEEVLAEIIHEIIPSAESVRFATTGSDAVMYALRIARQWTGKKKILVALGGYHGCNEAIHIQVGLPSSYNNGYDFFKFNDLLKVKEKLETKNYAACLLEPVQANNGCVPPNTGFLEELKLLCKKNETLLIFDEVVTGFRLSIGGAQQLYQVTPDLAVFSKAIAGGLPLSCICGKRELLELFCPKGPVFFGGTFGGHLLSLKSAITLTTFLLKNPEIYTKLNHLGEELREFLKQTILEMQLKCAVQGVGSMLSLAFGVESFPNGCNQNINIEAFNLFIEALAQEGVLHPPLPTETIFLSPVHEPHFELIKETFKKALRKVKQSWN